MQPINKIYLLLRLAQQQSFRIHSAENASFELETSNQCIFNCYYISFQDMQSFFQFLVSVIKYYHINGLHLFWDCFQWFCLQISRGAKYFFLSCPRQIDQGLIVVRVYHFQMWNKKEHNIIISRVINSHMGPMYIETPYITMYIETPNIIIDIHEINTFCGCDTLWNNYIKSIEKEIRQTKLQEMLFSS